MRTVEEVLTLAGEFESPEVSQLISCDLRVRHADRWIELIHILDEDKIFRCNCCGRKVSYMALEGWCCDFDDLEEGLICSSCYEEEMGEDL